MGPVSPERFLAAGARRIRRVRAVEASLRWLPAAALGMVALALVARVAPWSVLEPLALLMPLLALVVMVGLELARPLPLIETARVADRGLASREALSAWLEFRDGSGVFAPSITARAEQVASGSSLKMAVPSPRPGPWKVVGVVLAAALAGWLLVIESPAERERAEDARERAAVDQAASQLTRTAEELETANPEAAAALRELVAELEGLGAAEALERLAAEEAALRAQAGEDLLSAAAAANGLDASLQARPLPGAAGGTAAEQLRAAAEALAGGELDPAEQAELAERLDYLAATQVSGSPEVAEAL